MLKDCMETADQVTQRLRAALMAAGVESAFLDARLLVQKGASYSEADMITKGQTPLSAQQIEKIDKFTERRVMGEPVSRIAGEKEFWSLPFKISPATLDPRPDTETLVEAVLKYTHTKHPNSGVILKEPSATEGSREIPRFAQDDTNKKPLRILDLGAGSGCILISLLRELPHATGIGIDLNPGAIAIARENAAALGVESRIEFRQGSWFEPLAAGESFDIIVSNPPYIPESDIESLTVEVRNHDPILALAGGKDGLEAYKNILKDLKKHLECGGRAYFEIGQGQGPDLSRLVDDSNMRVCESYPDLAGILRVVEITYGEN